MVCQENLERTGCTEAILNSFKSFFKTCQFDMQIIIKSKKENLIQHINSMKKNQEKENESLEMKINELASLENIQKVIKDEGLVYNNDKIKNID